MSLLIRSEKDLPLLEKAHLAKKLNKLSKTISESFARKIYGEDPKKPIQFSKDPDKTKTVKVQFAKVKDHLLSKIHEARDTSFYNILALYFEQYFKLIKHGEKESNHMTDAQFNQFLEEINDLNEQLGIVYEQVYPEDYKGYILMQVDRSNLDQPPFSLTGTLMRDEPDDDCKFTGGQLTQIDSSKTFTDIDKHRQIKYIGGKEYYMSMGEYGTIYLQGNDDDYGDRPRFSKSATTTAPPPTAPPPTAPPQEAIATPTPPGAVPVGAAQGGGRRKKHKKSKKYYKKTQAKKRKKTKKR